MDQATFNKMMQEYEKARPGRCRTSTPADWEKDGVEWAGKTALWPGTE